MIIYKAITVAAAFCLVSLTLTGQNRTELQASVGRGKIVYAQTCLACHQIDGSGVPNLTPPLIKTSFVLGDKGRLIDIVLKGLKGVEIDGESFDNPMPSFASLDDKQVADVLTYIRNSFSNKASGVRMEEVGRARKSK
jgi:mono/diheme cytochrome c family protein